MTERRKLIAGNWKMNGLKADGLALASDLAGRLKGAGAVPFDLLVCPPFPLLFPVGEAIKDSPLALGGQDCAPKTSGAHTGDVAPTMLTDAGCRYVILGHSERRADHAEADALIAAKAAAAHKEGLIAIVCVGETEAQRDAGQADAVVSGQLAGSIPAGATAANTVIAYEPVWAIGTGKTATPDDVKAMHANIRATLDGKIADPAKVLILYGGSVKPGNAAELMAVENVDGALVGGAALKADDFWAIATSCR
ncbi:triose-phosphate isomerase [Azospirillum doebereinerae]|uniref:Triosephosphate isomerase n=1 Tax=Azospirillum doebereinerae TaxID=92933 RepID=A0A433J8R8_9PROT|nr:triose-phosphate isomerase [Azospirillum doebereinerae]MCG5243188.1 triose-phosphate isomerase [Azospirillum doebereinerae]RUQ70744.1 triose-phosphate isomerase [Azospirillum doebereinerae]